MPLSDVRALFPHTEDTIYLNHAATSPLSVPVMEAIDDYLEERHRTNIENFETVFPLFDETRIRLAQILGTQADRVDFSASTSTALNILARGLSWQEGDRIAIPACEFPANVYPFLDLEREGVVVDFIPHQESTFTLEDVEHALKPRTRLLTLSWVQFLSGFRADLEAIGALCRERDVIFCIDAIQGLGALELDVEALGIDFLASGSHKWMMGTQGVGFFYVREALQERLTPVPGWLHGPVDWDNFFDYELRFHPDARRFRQGTPNTLGIVALHAAVGCYQDADPRWCEERVLENATLVAEGLEHMGLPRYGDAEPRHGSGIVTVRHPKAEALYEQLQAQNIVASVRNGMLRFSPTYYNSPEEIETAIGALAEIA